MTTMLTPSAWNTQRREKEGQLQENRSNRYERPEVPPLFDEEKMQRAWNALQSQQASMGPLGPATETAYFKDLQKLREEQLRPRMQNKLQQMGSSIHGGSARAVEQFERAARERAELGMAAAARREQRADESLNWQKKMSYFDNLLKGMNFEGGIRGEDFKNQFTAWMTSKNISAAEQQKWMSLLGAGMGVAAMAYGMPKSPTPTTG